MTLKVQLPLAIVQRNPLPTNLFHRSNKISMEIIKAALNRTGGISYHYMALKYQNTLWRRYHEQLNWLMSDWKHFCKELILVGPSGGYSLCSEFLESFAKVYVFEPDPVAGFAFRKKFPKVNLHWNSESPFFQTNKNSEQALWLMKSKFPDAAILFCNVIGQWPLLESINEQTISKFTLTLNQVYQSSWASYHDIFSGISKWNRWNIELQRKQVHFNNIEDIERYWQSVGGRELTDHLTFKKFIHAKKIKHLIWPLTKKQIHIIEWAQG